MKDYQEALDVLADRELDYISKIAVKDLQELIMNFKNCRNELCQKCGNYKEEHLGKCKDCKWN